MTLIRRAHNSYHIKITCGVIAEFLSLGYPELEFNEDLCACLNIPYSEDFRKPIENDFPIFSSIDELMDMCAEMGMIDKFYDMTPEQIIKGHKAYCERLMSYGNLIIGGIRKAYDKDSEPFDYAPQISREETFEKLGLEELK